jgi:hypothetical protein
VSTLPDLPDPKYPAKPEPKVAPTKGIADGTRGASDSASPGCLNTSCAKITLGQDKAAIQLMLIYKANAIRDAVTAQIAAATNGGVYAPPDNYCPKEQGVNFVLPTISVVLPQALRIL